MLCCFIVVLQNINETWKQELFPPWWCVDLSIDLQFTPDIKQEDKR